MSECESIKTMVFLKVSIQKFMLKLVQKNKIKRKQKKISAWFKILNAYPKDFKRRWDCMGGMTKTCWWLMDAKDDGDEKERDVAMMSVGGYGMRQW